MTISYHRWQQIRMLAQWAILILILFAILVAVTGCRADGGGFSLNPLTWFGKGPDPSAPADPTQAQVAAGVSRPIALVSGILMLSAAGFLILGKDIPRALMSAGAGIGLVVINGLIITLLKNTTAVWVLLGVTGLITVLWLAKDTLDLNRKVNGRRPWKKSPGTTSTSPSDGSPPPSSSAGPSEASSSTSPAVAG